MLAHSRLVTIFGLVAILPGPALAHPGVPGDLASQLGHVLSHPAHLLALAAVGVVALGLGVLLRDRRGPARASRRPRGPQE